MYLNQIYWTFSYSIKLSISVKAAKCVLELSSCMGPDYDQVTKRLITGCCQCQLHQKAAQHSINKLQQEFQKIDSTIEQIIQGKLNTSLEDDNDKGTDELKCRSTQ